MGHGRWCPVKRLDREKIREEKERLHKYDVEVEKINREAPRKEGSATGKDRSKDYVIRRQQGKDENSGSTVVQRGSQAGKPNKSSELGLLQWLLVTWRMGGFLDRCRDCIP